MLTIERAAHTISKPIEKEKIVMSSGGADINSRYEKLHKQCMAGKLSATAHNAAWNKCVHVWVEGSTIEKGPGSTCDPF